MFKQRIRSIVTAFTLPVLLLFSFAFYHNAPTDMQEYAMGSHTITGNQIECQSVCSATKLAEKLQFSLIEKQHDKKLFDQEQILFGVGLFAMCALFVVKRLYEQSSWRPPDILRLQSRFSSGL